MTTEDFKLKSCPFCGGEMKFYRELEGKHFVQYWMHAEQSGCVLDQMFMPFTIGAGDARPEDGYVGEYGEAWNRRADVRPVVPGRWVDSKGGLVPWDEMNEDCPRNSAYCSVCGEWLTASDEYPTTGNFCPNCGADMREKADGT